jgi:UDP-N-acetylmuramyl pentapeptide phosphotransferase/UDP-N-acetylglucosamine-1-phosphate transferase
MPYVGGFISGLIILFFVGLKDDILVISPLTKFSGQFLAATIVVFFGNTMISSLHGFFGIGDIPLWLGYVLTIFVFLVTTNAFNFIDGVDGLSASLGSIAAIAFGVWFYLTAQYQLAMVAFVLAFALFAFLRYNLFSTRNKVFMGDTGSMLIGYVLSFLAIQFNETDLLLKQTNHFFIYPAPAVAFGIMIIPYFDMLRVIYIRLIQHRNVFAPDNYHIHHLLIKLGLTHKQVTLVLSLVSIVFIFFIFWLSSFVSIRRLVLIELLLALLLSFIPEILLTKK